MLNTSNRFFSVKQYEKSLLYVQTLRFGKSTCSFGTNENRKSSSNRKQSLPPSYKFNDKDTNPTTIKQLIRQLIFPTKPLDGDTRDAKIGLIGQIFSLIKNPGLKESLLRFQQKTVSISDAVDCSKKYDYIVVGAGSAGCALAYRLATSHLESSSGITRERKKVLLIEAGPKDTNPWIHIPVGYFKTLHNPKIGWGYKVEDGTSGLNGRGIAWPRAKVLGGCSSVNGLLWVRGIPQDYNNWDDVTGSHGIWSWDKIKECFKRLEGHMELKENLNEGPNINETQIFGSNGPITISDTRYKTGLCNAFIRACEKELKLVKRTREQINILQEEKESQKLGFCSILRSVGMGVVGYFQLTTNNGFRSSAAVGYLNSATRLGSDISLDVLTGCNVDRVLFEKDNPIKSEKIFKEGYNAIGIEVSEHQKSHSFMKYLKSSANNTDVKSKVDRKTHKIYLKTIENSNEIHKSLPEIILSAGAINTPQILHLSGIGFDDSKSIDGKIYSLLKGVGKNLQDHLQIRLVYQCPSNIPTLNTTLKYPWHYLRVGMEYVFYQSGPLSMAASSVAAFVNSRKFVFGENLCHIGTKINLSFNIDMNRKIPDEELDGVSMSSRFTSSPDIQYHLQPLSSALSSPGKGFDPMSAFTASVCQLRPTSTGWIETVSNNPEDKPKIHANYLSTKVDEDCVIRAIELTRQLCLRSESMKEYVEHELVPVKGLRGKDVSHEKERIGTMDENAASDDGIDSSLSRKSILRQAKRIAESIYHPVGTCKMGKFRMKKDREYNGEERNDDDFSVVDPLLRVHGISSLRVADASIMPQITSGNTNAPSIMIGERCADLILNGYNEENFLK